MESDGRMRSTHRPSTRGKLLPLLPRRKASSNATLQRMSDDPRWMSNHAPSVSIALDSIPGPGGLQWYRPYTAGYVRVPVGDSASPNWSLCPRTRPVWGRAFWLGDTERRCDRVLRVPPRRAGQSVDQRTDCSTCAGPAPSPTLLPSGIGACTTARSRGLGGLGGHVLPTRRHRIARASSDRVIVARTRVTRRGGVVATTVRFSKPPANGLLRLNPWVLEANDRARAMYERRRRAEVGYSVL